MIGKWDIDYQIASLEALKPRRKELTEKILMYH